MNRKHERTPAGAAQEGDAYGGAQYRQENDDNTTYAKGQGRSKTTDDVGRGAPRAGVKQTTSRSASDGDRAHPGNNPSGASASAATGGSTSGGATAPASDSAGPRRAPVDPQR